MSAGFEANADEGANEAAPQGPQDAAAAANAHVASAQASARPPIVRVVPRSTVRDTWAWLWKDTAQRVIPLAAAGAIYSRYFTPERRLPYSRAELGRELLLGAAVGLPLAAITAGFRAWVAPGYRLPTRADQAVQTAFYLALNAPAEEMFWRGTVQHLAARLLRHLPAARGVAAPLAWALATAGYGAYHRLGNWSWRSIAGVTFAGTVFGALYQLRPRDRALVAVTLAHGLTTAAFLSWGDVVLHQLALRRARRRYAPHAISQREVTAGE